ncbi:neprilysin-1 [Drosophila tropicalis]|uniref:neprilysin-1 n=1 Tax=Drosophila tropicalis TaxID=46794 RepID=UPI0035ABB60F
MWCININIIIIICITIIIGSGSNKLLSLLELPESISPHIDPKTDPCKDFYNFACGNWAKVYRDRSFRSQVDKLDYVFNRRLADLLEEEEAYNEKQNTSIEKLLKTNYKSCRKLSREAYKPDKFVNFLIDWSGKNKRNEPNWKRLLGVLMNFGLSQVLGKHLNTLDIDKHRWLTHIQPFWPQFWQENNEETQSVILQPLRGQQFQRLFQKLHLNLDNRNLWRRIKHLEKQITQIEQDDIGTESAIGLPVNWILPLSKNFSAPTEKYLQRLNHLLSQQSPGLLAPYLLLRLQHRLEYSLEVSPRFSRLPCSTQTRQFLTHAAVWLMARSENFESWDFLMQKVFTDIKQEFRLELIQNRNHFPKESQQFLYDKLDKMRLRLSVLPYGVRGSDLEQLLMKYYENLALNDSDYYGNLLKLINHIDFWSSRSRVSEDFYVVQPDDYGSFASPFFLPQSNEMILPLSLLGPSLSGANQSNIWIYSSLGFLIGHELSHGFTPNFAFLYDSRGNRMIDQMETTPRFREKGKCLLDLYGDMADEKFADLMGLTMAFKAYAKIESHPLTKRERQQFFLNFAQFFCEDKDELDSDTNEEHGGNRERVNEAMENLSTFRQSFHCEGLVKKGRPSTKCKLY